MGIEILAKAMGLPLFRRETRGLSTQTGKQYVPTHDDEVEDLYSLLEWTKVSCRNVNNLLRNVMRSKRSNNSHCVSIIA